ncbi:MAG: crotonase [Desulfobacteraceae bacterium]|nr:MAG: crotonase [Desulfobacteraceae bacterium]
MGSNVILRENLEGIEILTFNRPDKLNALNPEVMDTLDRIIPDLENNSSIRAVILRGAGEKSFVAGADIPQFLEFGPLESKAFALKGQRILHSLEHLPKPVIAAINGFALGGGLEIAMACHIRIAADTAQMGQPEVKLGIMPGYAGTQRLPRIVGKGRALELIMRGHMITAQEALAMGLVNQVVPLDKLMGECFKIAKEIMAQSPIAVKTAIEAINHGLNLTFEEACTLEANLFATLFATQDQKEGARAFLEKRTPHFKNH